MRKMTGIWGLTLLVLLFSPATSEALWPERKPATAGEAATEHAKQAARDTADAVKNVGESIKQTANAAYETTADAAKSVTGGARDTGATGAAYRDSAGRYVDDTYSSTRGRAADAAGAVRDATYRGAQTVTGGKQDHGSAGPTGAAYRDAAGNYVADTASTTRSMGSGTAEAIKDTAARATQTVADTARAAGQKASEAATATKDAAVGTAQAARDKAAQAYDATADTLGAASDKTADTVGSTRDRVWGTPEGEKTYTQRAKDMAGQTGETAQGHASYVGQRLSESSQAAADAARRAGQNVRDGAARTYDSTTNTLGTPVRDQDWGYGNEDRRGVMDKAGDYYQSAKDTVNDAAYRTGDAVSNAAGATKDAATRTGEATRDTAYRTMGYEAPSDQGYASRGYDSARGTSSDAYEAGKDKLGNIIEILGWQRAADHEHANAKNSPYDVVVGNTRYVWNQRPDSDGSYYQRAKDTMGEVTDKTSDKASRTTNDGYDSASRVKDKTVDGASRATNAAYDSAGRIKDKTVDVANRATENVKDMAQRTKDTVVDTANRATESVKETTGQTGKAASDYTQKGKEALGAGAAALGANKLATTPKGGRLGKVLRFLHLLAYAVTYGSAIWMTFISGRILSRTIPREQFRNVQTKMFPYFLKFMVAGQSVLTLLSSLTGSSSKWPILGSLFLIATTAYNAFVLEPKTTKTYLERLRMEKEEGRGYDAAAVTNSNTNLAEKQKKFNEVHGFSALLNLLNVAGLTYHGWNMA